MRPKKREWKSKQFKLPLDEGILNTIYNRPGVIIHVETVFQDKSGDITVFLKWEQDVEERTTFSREQERQVDAL